MMQQTTEIEVEAAQVRVTPHELARATARLDARREAEAEHVADTIALGEAVEQLDLAATPEELLTEVQTLRAQTLPTTSLYAVAQQTTLPNKTGRECYEDVIFGTIVFGTIAFLIVLLGVMQSSTDSTQARNDEVIAGIKQDIAKAEAQTAAAAQTTPVAQSATADAQRVRNMNPGLFQSLALKEGQAAHCSLENLEAVAGGANPAQIWVTKKASYLTWQLLRRSGSFCVQCWATPAQAAQIANGQAAKVAAYAYGSTSVPILLPLDKFKEPSTSRQASDGTVVEVQVN